MGRLRRATLSLLLLGVIAPSFAAAGLPVLGKVSGADAALLDAAELVVEVRVTAVDAAPAAPPARDHSVAVERVVKGSSPGGELVVRVPGGVDDRGTGFLIPGAPRFQPGDHLLVFLSRRADGVFGLSALGGGVFTVEEHEVRSGHGSRRERVAVHRHSAAAHAAHAAAEGSAVRHLDSFAAWLTARARGVELAADYWREPTVATGDPAADALRLARSSDEAPPLGCGADGGHLLRWFAFDTGGGVPWFPSTAGFPGADAGHAALDAALSAWSGVAGSSVRLLRGEVSTADGGLGFRDGMSTVRYEDPDDEIAGSLGTLLGDPADPTAVTGLWFDCTTEPWIAEDGSEQQVHRILEADVVLQDGLEAELLAHQDGESSAAEILAHELGHALGLLDSSAPEAIMASTRHFDGRGARLTTEDGDALRMLYGPHGSTPPAPPAGLLAVPATSPEDRIPRVLLRWRDRALDESEQRLDIAVTSRFIELPLAIPPDTEELLVHGLPGGREVRMRVRSINELGSSSPSNIATVLVPVDDRCLEDGRSLCLLGGSYRVRLRHFAAGGSHGRLAHAAPLADGAGAFWFFHPENLEGLVRLELDPAGRLRLDTSSLTTIAHEIVVEELSTGRRRTLRRDEALCSATLEDLFPEPSALHPSSPFRLSVDLDPLPIVKGAGDEQLPAICRERDAICLHDGRFVLDVAGLDTLDATPLAARGIADLGDVGLFAFGEATDLEVAVKILDARALGGGFWLFHSGFGDRPYLLTIEDRATGLRHRFSRPLGHCGGMAELAAP